MDSPKTHFEQVPVEVAVRIAQQERARASGNGASTRKWEQIAHELLAQTDSAKMKQLAFELNDALDNQFGKEPA
jgi:hypothetical protein